MNVVVTWRIVHHKGTKDGKIVPLKSVVFEESCDGVRESVRSIDYDLWERYRSERGPDVRFVQKGDLVQEEVHSHPPRPRKPTTKTKRRRRP
jgi:hypothetical protein